MLDTKNLLSITVILLSISSVENYKFQLATVKHKYEVLGTSIAKIAKNYYLVNQSHLTIVKSIKVENSYMIIDVLDGLINNFKKDLTTFQIEEALAIKDARYGRRISNLFFIDSVESATEMMNVINSINFRVRKIFTIVSILELSENEMRTIFGMFMKKFIVNTNIVSFGPHKTLNLFTFFPFQNESDCNNTNPVKISAFNESSEEWSNKNNFYNRKANNLVKCPIRIGAAAASSEPGVIGTKLPNGKIEIHGIEKEIFLELEHRLNFTAIFVPYLESVGSVHPNGTGYGVLGKLMNKEVDVVIGFVSLQYIRTIYFSETNFYSMNPLMLVVPSGEEYGDLEKLLMPFEMSVWFAFYFVLATSVLFTIISSRFPVIYNFVIGLKIKHPILNLTAIYFGISQPRLPSRNFSRFILMNFLIYCLILRTVYQGAYFNILVSNKLKPPVNSIAEMVQKKYTFYIFETLASRLQGINSYPRRYIYPNIQIEKYRRMTLNPNFKGAVFSYEAQTLYVNQLNYKNFTYTICKEHFLNPSFVFYFQKDHYLVPKVNEVIDMMLANGLVDHISSKFADKGYLKSKPDGGRKVLEINRLYGAIEIYFLCTFISFLIFVMELATKLKRFFHCRMIK